MRDEPRQLLLKRYEDSGIEGLWTFDLTFEIYRNQKPNPVFQAVRAVAGSTTNPMVVCMGKLPKVPKRPGLDGQPLGDGMALVLEGDDREWYLAGWQPAADDKRYPEGPYFYLSPWPFREEKIDQYERRKYQRVTIVISDPSIPMKDVAESLGFTHWPKKEVDPTNGIAACKRSPSNYQDTRWATYVNQDLGHRDCGRQVYVAIGPQNTWKKPENTAPDGPWGLGWRYYFEGWLNLETGEVQKEALPTT